MTSVTDPLTHATTFTYNNANLVLTATNALSKTTTYTYDNNGNVLSVTDAKANVTTYVYNNKDQLTSIADDLSQVWTFAYDAVGNLTSKTNPRSKATTYVYDNLGRLTSETDPRSQVRSYTYDANGRLTARTDPKSQVVDYTYNDRNELTRIDYPGTDYVSFAYNDSGARTQMVDGTGTTSYSYDNLYRLTSVTFPGSRTVSYAFDDAGRPTSLTYPGGTNQVTYGYDNANRLTSVTDWGSNAIAYAYDDAGRMTTKTLPSGTGIVSSYTYDTADRLTGISHVKGGSTTIASVAYTLDDVGNRTQRVDQQGTHTYAYDDVYRLTSVTYPGPSTTTYAFDAFGNRTAMTVGSATTTYAYDDADRITTVTPPSPASAVTYTWDNNGDLTARGSDSFSWDYEDRMVSATVSGTTTTFAYRGDGLRNSRTTGGTTTTFTWDIASGLPVVIDDGKQYVYGAGLESMIVSGSRYYYLADGLGSTMAVVDATGAVQKSYTYDIYGKPTATGTLANEFDFAGQQTDPTGLQYLRARYMDPETGVFLAREPLASRPTWLASLHGYAGANPARFTDPSGRMLVDGAEGGVDRVIQPPPRIDPDPTDDFHAVDPPSDAFWEDFVQPDGKWNIHLCRYVVRATESGNRAKDCGESGISGVTVGEYDSCALQVWTAEGYGFQGILCRDTRAGHEREGHGEVAITSVPFDGVEECIKGAIVGVGIAGAGIVITVATGGAAAPGAAAVTYTLGVGALSGCISGIVGGFF